MSRPERFAIHMSKWDEKAQDFDTKHEEFSNERDAKAAARSYAGKWNCEVFERTDIRDATPAEDPPGLLWDYTETAIWPDDRRGES